MFHVIEDLRQIAEMSIADVIRSMQRGFKISILEGAITVMGSALTSSMLIPFMIRLGAGVEELGMYTAGSLALVPLSQFLAAIIVNRFRPYRLHLMTVCALMGRLVWVPLTAIAWGFPGGVWEVIVMVLLSHPVSTIAGMAWTDILTDLVEPERRGRAIAVRNSVINLSNILGFTLASMVYSLPFPTGYMYGFAAGTMLLLSAVPLFYFYGDPKRPRGVPLDFRTMARTFNWREALKDSLSMGFWNSSINLVGAIWTYHLFKVMGASDDWVAIMNTAASATGILASIVWGRLYDRFGPKGVFLMSGPGISLIPILFPQLPSLGGQVALQIYSTMLYSGFNMAAFNYAVSFDPAYRPFYIAIYNSVPAVASSVTSYAGAVLYKSYGTVTFYISGVLRLAALAILLRLISERGVEYEELRVSSYLYRLAFVSRDLATFAMLELFVAARLIYSTFLVLFLLWMLATLYYLAIKLIGI